MGIINQLDQHLSNMIAAGEVVERPSGIVKELVENSIDAHAQHIEIQIAQGGIDTITIIDDGDGMDHVDALLAFERHATSKLKEVNDLWNIHTMGFRGEALPSIASVSHVILRTNNKIEGSEVEIRYGELIANKPCGTPKGTMIEVKNLFQKTPARFKHLKSPQYEFSLISDVVQKFALAHPDIGFSLSHDGRQIFSTRGNGNLLEVLMQIYGRECAKTAIAIDDKDIDYHITGYVMQPSQNRATKYYMLLYINGRMIRSYHLQKSIVDAFSPYMPKDRFPIAVINIEMDAQLVDVNVHPSKWEIRLSKEKQLEKLLYQSISKALHTKLVVPRVNVKMEKQPKVEMQKMEFTYARDPKIEKMHKDVNESFLHPEREAQPQPIQVEVAKSQPLPLEKEECKMSVNYPQPKTMNKIEEEDELAVKEAMKSYQPKPKEHKVEERVEVVKAMDVEATQKETADKVVMPQVQEVVISEEEHISDEAKETYVAKNPCLPQLRVIGQFHNCYIIAEGEKGLYIIDQHAAQERYHYEVIRNEILKGNIETQPLLIPITIETNVSAIAHIDELNAVMKQIGITMESFGNQTLVCRELPVWMKDIDEASFLRDMIDICQKDKEVSVMNLRKHAIATMACHSSIRFNRNLTMEEMKRVIEDLGKCEQPFHCPHGRPTLICMEDKDLIHDFERG